MHGVNFFALAVKFSRLLTKPNLLYNVMSSRCATYLTTPLKSFIHKRTYVDPYCAGINRICQYEYDW